MVLGFVDLRCRARCSTDRMFLHRMDRNMRKMSKKKWRALYIQTLIDEGGFAPDMARDNFNAIDCPELLDLTSDPVDSALDEISYWKEESQ